MVRTFRDVEKALREIQDKIESLTVGESKTVVLTRPTIERAIELSEEKIRNISINAFGSAMNNDLRLSEDGSVIHHDLEHVFSKMSRVNGLETSPNLFFSGPLPNKLTQWSLDWDYDEFKIINWNSGSGPARNALRFIAADLMSSDQINAFAHGSIYPAVNLSYDLGSSSNNWDSIYLRGFIIGQNIIPTDDLTTNIGAVNRRILHAYIHDVRVSEQILSTWWAHTIHMIPISDNVSDIGDVGHMVKKGYFRSLRIYDPIAPRPLKVDVNHDVISALINLASTSDVTGVLPRSNGGAGITSAGISATYLNVIYNFSTTGATLQYLDWGGVPRSQAVITGVFASAVTMQFSAGILI